MARRIIQRGVALAMGAAMLLAALALTTALYWYLSDFIAKAAMQRAFI